MCAGLYVMERNGYIGSPADLHRIDDFNYNQNQDRGPVNALAFAYSGFPLVYPDIVGGTFVDGENKFDVTVTPRMKTYMMRNAQWASVHPSMSVGQPPWEFDDPQVGRVMLGAAQLHERLHPYIYSQAVRFFRDGYPWTMTPLPIAYPDDEATYGRENAQVRGYEWMIGDALLATPLYGNNFAIAERLDIYLPHGAWIDYDSGMKFDGPHILREYAMPVGKTPLFVGGTGIVIEKEGEKLLARLYPITRNAETVFWGRDGKTESHLALRNVDWRSPRVVDTSAKMAMKGEWLRHAYQFVFEPGHDYEIR
jgi:alpha-glucosidase (family GH31 glycosyl hydrolase)